MGAYFTHNFKEGFLLDERGIKKIHQILVKRLASLKEPPAPKFTIYRLDSFSYTTTDIQELFNEENSKTDRIIKLKLSAETSFISSEKSLGSLVLEFDRSPNIAFPTISRPNTTLTIEGEDRDLVGLLFSDLKGYLSNEINVFHGVAQTIVSQGSFWLGSLLFLGYPLIRILTLTGQAKRTASIDFVNRVLQSNDTNEKLNFLIDFLIKREIEPASQSSAVLSWSGSLSGILLLVFLAAGGFKYALGIKSPKIINYLFPSSLFLFGKEKKEYEEVKERRSKIFWGVIVALVIGVVPSLAAWLISLR